MTLSTEDRETLAEDFVTEYLERTPEYLDVVEFIDENAEGDIETDDITGEDVDDIFKRSVALLNDHAQRFADRNN